MASNTFGKILKMTTWGESHGSAIGVVLDGFPAGVEISIDEIHLALSLRAPGNSPFTSPRKETDQLEILSGWFDGKTTGAPISLLIPNKDVDSSKYESLKDLLRPGHANFTYLEKYGLFDHRGGGRASARETACRVAAGAFAKKFLKQFGIEVVAYLSQVGHEKMEFVETDVASLRQTVTSSPIYCPDQSSTKKMTALLSEVKASGDSIGGAVEFIATGMPTGLGDPIYQKLEAELAYALMSLPATKGFEMGSGFNAVTMKGSEHNDLFVNFEGKTSTTTNHSGGVLGGISNGMPVQGRVAFKPASSIQISQETLNLNQEKTLFELPEGSRHDPCVAIRGVAAVEAMVAWVLADALLLNRCAKI